GSHEGRIGAECERKREHDGRRGPDRGGDNVIIMPSVRFYRRDSRTDWEWRLLAIIELDESGTAVLSEGTDGAPSWILGRYIADADGQTTPADGERYLRALAENSKNH